MRSLYLVPLGTVDRDAMTAIASRLESNFGLTLRRMEPWPEPLYAFDAQRKQFSSIPILRDLVARCPADATRLLAVTEMDLFIPMLSFIFGQAQLNGTIAMVSLARLRQEYYGLPMHPRLLAARAIKETLHELGHSFGLIHCLNPACPMSLSTNIRQVDAKGDAFCASCQVFLHESLRDLDRQPEEVPDREDHL